MNEFLQLLFAKVPPGYLINIWTLQDKRSYWLKPDDDLPDGIVDKDVYFGPGLSNIKYSSRQRLKIDQVAGITCLWVDVDYGEGHKKNVPPDEKTAGKLVRACGIHPSLVVHSGNGWHCYWLLDQPWIFESEQDRQEAARLVEHWQAHLRSIFQKENYTLDATHDLTRVLRVPETKNFKDPDCPKDVKIIWPQYVSQLIDCHRYSRDQFYTAIGKRPAKNQQGQASGFETVVTDSLALDPVANAPVEKLMALLKNSTDFHRTWNHQRQDMTDKSPSGYDMALANIAAAAGWSDQDIVNLIIQWRRENGHDIQKALRPDYIKRTIAKARVDSTIDDAVDAIESPEDMTDEKRHTYLNVIAERLGFAINRVIKQGLEKSQYSLILEDGREVYIGTANTLLNLTKFRACVFDAAGVAVPSHKQDKWLRTCEIISRIADVVEDEDAIESELVSEWLGRYLEDRRCNDDEWKDSFIQSLPFYKDRELYVHAVEFLKYVKYSIGQKVFELSDIRRNLRKLGFKSKKMSVRNGDDVCKRNYWCANRDHVSPKSAIGKNLK